MENEHNDINVFAQTNFRGRSVKFGIKSQDRQRHFYIIGKTGVGKTTLQENMAIQDIQNGKGLAIVDPHGEFAAKMLDYVPAHRVNDVVYFNPADLGYPIAFNIVEKVDPEHRFLIASGLMAAFKKIWIDLWSARMEYICRNAVLALLEYPGSTLLGINRMLADESYRQKVVDNITDTTVRAFWVNEFAKYPDRFREEAVAPIQNKIGQFISNPLIRNIIGQTKSSIDIRKVMDEGKILIINLSKGLLGEDNSNLLGAMLISRIQLAAMSRMDMPEEERPNFYLYVDEFQNFATEAFEAILAEARKYHLNLILGHQYIAQLSEEVRDAIFGNVGTMVCFRIGAADAEYFEKEFTPDFIVQDLVNLGFAQIYLKLMIDGMASRPFSATTLPPLEKPAESHREKIIQVSRERYATPRPEVEDKIKRWSEEALAAQAAREESKKKKKAKPKFSAICSGCGKETQVAFEPDGVRPVYCTECLEKAREAKEKTGKFEVPHSNHPRAKTEAEQDKKEVKKIDRRRPSEETKKDKENDDSDRGQAPTPPPIRPPEHDFHVPHKEEAPAKSEQSSLARRALGGCSEPKVILSSEATLSLKDAMTRDIQTFSGSKAKRERVSVNLPELRDLLHKVAPEAGKETSKKKASEPGEKDESISPKDSPIATEEAGEQKVA